MQRMNWIRENSYTISEQNRRSYSKRIRHSIELGRRLLLCQNYLNPRTNSFFMYTFNVLIPHERNMYTQYTTAATTKVPL